MIQKLRRKVVLLCMSMSMSVVAIVFFSIFLFNSRNVKAISQEVLHRVMDDTGSHAVITVPSPENEQTPYDRLYGLDLGGEGVRMPYFTVSLWHSRQNSYTAYVTGGTYGNLENTEELREILTECLSQRKTEGVVKQYQLRYLRRDNVLYEEIAFVDMSMELAMMRDMLTSLLLVAALAFFLLLGLSVLLARWVTAPVDRAWKQQRQFLSDASHELKTPLTVILSNAEMLSSAGLTDRPARWSDNIRSEARQMKSLVEQMLTLARADNMTARPVMGAVSLSDTAADCALAFEPVAFEANKPLVYHLCENVCVEGDRERLRQVISVLLDNAIKYGAAGGTITLDLEAADRQARLTVSNPGPPIPPEQLPHLFERFYRADASRGEQSGFGLGLPIAAAIAAEHRGTLRAESDARSTRFIFTMPLLKK